MDEINILIGCTGSVATIKLSILINKLQVRVIVTDRARHFYNQGDIPSHVEVYTDDLEWSSWKDRGDPVLHIELAKWADAILIAPLDANTLAKISQGLCDNLLSCVVRAWIFSKPFIFCPAMNTRMWEHPITSKQIAVLKEWGFIEIPCIVKNLMCGDTGLGAMADVDTITQKTLNVLDYIKKPY